MIEELEAREERLNPLRATGPAKKIYQMVFVFELTSDTQDQDVARALRAAEQSLMNVEGLALVAAISRVAP